MVGGLVGSEIRVIFGEFVLVLFSGVGIIGWYEVG